MNECIVVKRQKSEVIKQHGKSVRFISDQAKTYEVADVDGCLFRQHAGKRCDFFVRTSNSFWMVELKGRHVEHAVEQINASRVLLCNHIGERELIAVIVAVQCPAISGQQKFLKTLKSGAGPKPSKLILKSTLATIQF